MEIRKQLWIARAVFVVLTYLGMSMIMGSLDFTEWGWFARVIAFIVGGMFIIAPVTINPIEPIYTQRDMEDAFDAGDDYGAIYSTGLPHPSGDTDAPTFPEWLEQHNLTKKK